MKTAASNLLGSRWTVHPLSPRVCLFRCLKGHYYKWIFILELFHKNCQDSRKLNQNERSFHHNWQIQGVRWDGSKSHVKSYAREIEMGQKMMSHSMTFWLISPYPRREKYFGATVIKNTNSDNINFELWADNMFSITNTQPESAISIGQLNWQGMNAICNFTAISKVLINYYNINLYKKITRASNEKKVNLLIYTVSFVKQQNMILQRLAFVISRIFCHQRA